MAEGDLELLRQLARVDDGVAAAVKRPVSRSVTLPPTFSVALPLSVTECMQYVPAARVTLPCPLTVRSPERWSYVNLLPVRPAAGLNGLHAATDGATIGADG